MQLYHILIDRASINILKILYDTEFVSKDAHTMRVEDLRTKIPFLLGEKTITLLNEEGLITSERTDTGTILSITQKGKEFVEQFDKLRDVLLGNKQEQKPYQVQYDLTTIEQRILLLCARIKSETGVIVPLKSLAQEVYPYKEAEATSSLVSRNAKRLEQLNLIKRVKQNNRTFFDTTEVGERIIREQFVNIESLNPSCAQ